MGNLVFQATLGGQVNLVGPNTASTFNLNVPAVAGTLVTTGDTGTVTNTMLAGSIANAKLTNSSVTIGGTSIALGASSSAIANDITINGATVGRGAGAVSTNTAVGASALAANTTGSGNTALGYQSAYSVTTNGPVTAIGYQAGKTYNAADDFGSVFVGYLSGTLATGKDNVVVGGSALKTNSSGAFNTAIGAASLYSNTTASNNTAVGYQAGYSNTTASYNTALGHTALYSATTGYSNTSLGFVSGYSLTTGYLNTFVGKDAGYYVTTGAKNTILGAYTGNQGGLDIRTANNYIVLSDGDGNPRGVFDNSGNYLVGTASASLTSGNGVKILPNGGTTGVPQVATVGNSSSSAYGTYTLYSSSAGQFQFYVTYDGTVNARSTSIAGLSDEREKENIRPLETGLTQILALQPKRFDWKNGQGQNIVGFIAQQVQLVLPDLVSNYKINNDETRFGLKMGDMIPTMVKAIQEQQALIASQSEIITQLQADVAALKGQA